MPPCTSPSARVATASASLNSRSSALQTNPSASAKLCRPSCATTCDETDEFRLHLQEAFVFPHRALVAHCGGGSRLFRESSEGEVARTAAARFQAGGRGCTFLCIQPPHSARNLVPQSRGPLAGCDGSHRSAHQRPPAQGSHSDRDHREGTR